MDPRVRIHAKMSWIRNTGRNFVRRPLCFTLKIFKLFWNKLITLQPNVFFLRNNEPRPIRTCWGEELISSTENQLKLWAKILDWYGGTCWGAAGLISSTGSATSMPSFSKKLEMAKSNWKKSKGIFFPCSLFSLLLFKFPHYFFLGFLFREKNVDTYLFFKHCWFENRQSINQVRKYYDTC